MNIGASNVRFNSDLDYDGLFSQYDAVYQSMTVLSMICPVMCIKFISAKTLPWIIDYLEFK